MDDKKMNITSSQVMDLQQLIAGPLIATIEADTLSARSYLEYLLKIAFESYDTKTGTVGKMRMLTFTYDNQGIDGSRKQSVSIPLFTLVPLPLLQIQEADFDFDIKILDIVSKSVEEKFEESGGEGGSISQNRGFKLRASMASQTVEGNASGSLKKSLSANMKVKVKMCQADMPAGLANLLHLVANNPQVREVMDSGDVTQNENENG